MSTITRAAITSSSIKDGFVLEAPVLDEELQVDDDIHEYHGGSGIDGGGGGGGDEDAPTQGCEEVSQNSSLMLIALTTGLRVWGLDGSI